MNQWIAKALNVGVASVEWKSTFMLAAMRSAASGLAWAIIFLLAGNSEQFFPFLFLGAILGLGIMVPLALFSMIGAKVFPPIGILGFIPLIYMVCGDPILWLVEKFRPGSIPMDDFKPLNFKTILIVINHEIVESVKREAITSAKSVSTKAINKFRIRQGTTEKPTTADSVQADPEIGFTIEVEAARERYDRAFAEFKRLASKGGEAEAMREEMIKISDLCEADCAIPGPYTFCADKFSQIDVVGNFELIVGTLKRGHIACSQDRAFQEEIENSYFALGKLLWDMEKETLAFRAYIDGLNHWREAGNIIGQSSPILPRIAFVASRMFSKNALENGNTDLGVELLEFCEASGVDMNLEIDVSDARTS